MNMKLKTGKLKAGIIGLGVGASHIAGYETHPACEVTAVCDFAPEKLDAAKQKYPKLRFTTQADEILRDPDIDVVSIASYDHFHHEQIVKALENRKHVFVEKPLCLHPKEAEHIRSFLRKDPSLKLSSNLILRRSPRFQKLKEMIDSGKFGELFYVEGDYHYGRLHKITEGWRGELDFYSVIYGGGVHMVDLLLWLTGDTVEEVTAYGNQIASKGSKFRYNDCVASLLKFRSGLIGKVTVDFGSVLPHFHSLNLYGTKATFVNDQGAGKLFESRDSKTQPKEIPDAYPGVKKGDLLYRFVDSIVNGSEPEVSTEDVFRAMSVCFAMEESVKRNSPIKVRYI